MYHLARPLSTEAYRALCERANRFNAWLDTKRNRHGWASYRPEEVPADIAAIAPTNEERGLIEIQDLHELQPERLFCYVTRDGDGWKATNFPGQRLGLVYVGGSYSSPAFGRSSTRRPVRLACINGCAYFGTLYESSGDYARLRRAVEPCTPEAMELMRRANYGPGAI